MSSGGFIHGFRYNSRSLSHILAARNHKIRWPGEKVPLHGITSYILKRMNEMNGPYQVKLGTRLPGYQLTRLPGY